MEFGTIEREIYVEASPEVVFEVVSSPDHLQQWWPDEAHYDPVPGSTGEIVFGKPVTMVGRVVQLTVVEALPPRTFSFRWTHPFGEPAASGNSLFVTFELTPSGGGTLLKMTETGFREMGWEVAVLEQQYHEHITGWDFYLPRLVVYTRGAGGAAVTAGVAERIDDELWSAIGDPTRRRILDLLLADGDGTATSLSEQLPVTRQAVAKHLDVLDRVVLVRATPAGREKRYRGRRRPARPGRRPTVLGRLGVGRPAAADQEDRRSDRTQQGRLNGVTRSRNPQTKEQDNG